MAFLTLRNKTYHFRFRVPAKLVSVLCKCEIKASLRLGCNRPLAKKLAYSLATDCRYVTDRLTILPEAILMKLDQNALDEILRNHIRETIDQYVRSHAVNRHTLENTLSSLDHLIRDTKSVLDSGIHFKFMSREVDRLTKELGLDIEDDQRRVLAFHLTQSHLSGLQQAKGILDGSEPVGRHQSELQETNEITIAPDSFSPTLSELIDQYRKHQLSSGTWRPGSDRDANPKLNALAGYLGPDTAIKSVSVNDMQSYVELLQALPPNWSKLKAFRGVALSDLDPKVLIKKHERQLDTTTVRDYIILARSLFAYAKDLDMIDKNPVPARLMPKKKKGHAREERKAYTLDQLREIFEPERFLKWVNYGSTFNPARFWVPILLAVSAARLEEICGLRVRDLEHIDGHLCLHIVDHSERPLKTVNSARVVPLPPFISSEMGLSIYKEGLPDDCMMLFPQLTKAHGKLSHQFGKAWGRYVRDKAGVEDKRISPAHSFRHFTIDLLSKAMVPTQVVKQFAGHAPGKSETEQRYSKGLEVSSLINHCVPVIKETLDPIVMRIAP